MRRKNKLKQLLAQINKNKIAYLFLAPYAVPFTIFLCYPIIQAVRYSFYRFTIRSFRFVGLKNFVDIFGDPIFRKAIVTTCWFVIGSVPFIILISIMISALLIKVNSKLRTITMGIMYLPAVTSIITITLTWKWIYNYRNGILNYIVSLWGYENINWLSNRHTALPSLILILVYISLGVPVILYISAMTNIPKSLYDAAKIDGANEWQLLRYITIPLIRPTTLYLLIVLTIGTFQTFIIVYLMTGGGPYYRTTTLSYLLIDEAFGYGHYGVASSMGIILLIIISSLTVMQFKFFSRDIEY